ncbi:MAG: Ig-like domain-containing protein [Pseudomonadota bacterium]
MSILNVVKWPLIGVAMLVLAACGGGDGPGAQAAVYTIGGSATGLTGSGLVLQLNGGANLSVAASGAFIFATTVASGGPYSVTVATQPSSPSQTCTVTSGSGTATANVTSVAVACATSAYRVNGTVTGLSGSLVLRNNGANDLTVSADGAFSFPTAVPSGGAYAVTVFSHPTGPSQNCVVAAGSGTIGSADVSNVAVTCTTASFTVGGAVSGLSGSVVLRNTVAGVAHDVTVNTANYTFPAQLSGSAYSVQVVSQSGPVQQTCTATNPTGTVAAANVTNVAIACSTNSYAVGGSVSGLAGSGLVLLLNGGSPRAVSASGGFAFATLVNSGATYAVTVQTQPNTLTQVCTVTNGTGTVGGAAVTNVAVSCATSQFTVGGTVTNLGTGLVLRKGTANLAVSTSPYSFPAADSGTPYTVTVFTQPTGPGPGQSCTVANGTGTLTSANVTNVNVTCVNTDVTAPTVVTRTPLDTTVGTDLLTTVLANFSEALKPSSVTVASFTLTSAAGAVAGTVTLANGNQRAVFTPNVALAFNTTYTATLTTAIQDPSGNPLTANVVWTFNTGHKIAAGGYHTCARLDGVDNGKVKCWGSNQYGQLGRGDTVAVGDGVGGAMGSAIAPIVFGTNLVAVDIEAGENHTCARLQNSSTGADAGVKCWGRNGDGQLGLGDILNRGDAGGEMGNALPALNLGGVALEVAAGALHTCARLSDGSVKCWGRNESGIVGVGTSFAANPNYLSPSVPVPLGTGLTAVGIAATSGFHTCARLVNAGGAYAGVKCWGDNSWGQLGQGDVLSRGDNLNPMGNAVPAINFGTGLKALQLVVTSGHTCALLDNATVKCLGNNWYGQIGTGTTHPATNCVQANACMGDVPGETGIGLPVVDLDGTLTPVELAAGDRQTCARFTTGKVKCWGWNFYGQLGLGNVLTRGDDPGEMGVNLPFVNLSSTLVAVELSAGAFHECAVLSNGGVKCWGYNQTQSPQSGQGGELGLGNTDNRGDGVGLMGDSLPLVDLTP